MRVVFAAKVLVTAAAGAGRASDAGESGDGDPRALGNGIRVPYLLSAREAQGVNGTRPSVPMPLAPIRKSQLRSLAGFAGRFSGDEDARDPKRDLRAGGR